MKKKKKKERREKKGSTFIINLDEIYNGRRCPTEFVERMEAARRYQNKFKKSWFEPIGCLA